jgi:hypothetical protein
MCPKASSYEGHWLGPKLAGLCAPKLCLEGHWLGPKVLSTCQDGAERSGVWSPNSHSQTACWWSPSFLRWRWSLQCPVRSRYIETWPFGYYVPPVTCNENDKKTYSKNDQRFENCAWSFATCLLSLLYETSFNSSNRLKHRRSIRQLHSLS